MTSVLDTFNETAFKFVTRLQDATLEASKTMAGVVSERTASLPTWWSTPEPEAARDMVKKVYEVRSTWAEANEKFVLDLFEVWGAKPAVRKPAAKAA